MFQARFGNLSSIIQSRSQINGGEGDLFNVDTGEIGTETQGHFFKSRILMWY